MTIKNKLITHLIYKGTIGKCRTTKLSSSHLNFIRTFENIEIENIGLVIGSHEPELTFSILD
jgi:hypothetical protein